MIGQFQGLLMQLPEQYPVIFSPEQVQELIDLIRLEITNLGRDIVSGSVASVVGFITLLVYAILLPLLVFFFMKDKRRIIHWVLEYLPQDLHLAETVWRDLDGQIGNYVRGMFRDSDRLVGQLRDIRHSWPGTRHVAGAVERCFRAGAVHRYCRCDISVALVAYFNGDSRPILHPYGRLFCHQALDGNALVPVLFSEVVNLHPVAIITAVLVFGGLWGFWGVFFAIPLATLVQAVLTAWPTSTVEPDEPTTITET